MASRNTGKSRLTRLPQGCVPIRIVERRFGIGEGGQKQSRRTSFLGGKAWWAGRKIRLLGNVQLAKVVRRQTGACSTSLCPYFWFGTTCNNTSKYWFPRIPGAKFVPSGQVNLFLFIYILRVKIIPSSEPETVRVAFWHHVPILNEAHPRPKLPIRPEIISRLEFLKPVQCMPTFESSTYMIRRFSQVVITRRFSRP